MEMTNYPLENPIQLPISGNGASQKFAMPRPVLAVPGNVHGVPFIVMARCLFGRTGNRPLPAKPHIFPNRLKVRLFFTVVFG